jgi:hypothetical protein
MYKVVGSDLPFDALDQEFQCACLTSHDSARDQHQRQFNGRYSLKSGRANIRSNIASGLLLSRRGKESFRLQALSTHDFD